MNETKSKRLIEGDVECSKSSFVEAVVVTVTIPHFVMAVMF